MYEHKVLSISKLQSGLSCQETKLKIIVINKKFKSTKIRGALVNKVSSMASKLTEKLKVGKSVQENYVAESQKLYCVHPNMRDIVLESGSNTTRVGRWMSKEEYNKMILSGKVQMSGDNKVHVANPADINAFGKQAPKGSLYVEFDVLSNTISKGGKEGWEIINGPNSLLDRLNAKKGLPRITEMPEATNITIEGSK